MSNHPSKELIGTICVVKNLKFWKASLKESTQGNWYSKGNGSIKIAVPPEMMLAGVH